MINKIIRNFIAKRVAGRSDDGIMITLKDPQKVEFQTSMIQDLLMRNGIDPNAIQSEQQLKMILNQISTINQPTSGIRGTESAKVFNRMGEELDPNQPIIGGTQPGKSIDTDTFSRLAETNTQRMKQKIADKKVKTEEDIKADLETQNQNSIQKLKMQKMIDDAIDDASPGFSDGDTKYDAELVAENLAERMGLVYDDLPTKQRLDIYDQAYTGLSKQRFKNQKTPKGDDPENMADGGRIGLKGGLTPSDYLKVKDMLNHYHDYRKGGGKKLSKAAFAKAFFRENNADGGRIGYFMGSRPAIQKGLAALREMLRFFSKGKNRTGSDILKMVNPKTLNKLLNDPAIYNKFSVKEGLAAPDMIKNMQKQMTGEREKVISEILDASKNIRKADENTIKYKNEMIEEMVNKGADRETAKGLAQLMTNMAEDAAGKMPGAPKLTNEGVEQLELILKDMQTGGKKARDLNADGGRIGLKDGMNRRTFMKFLAGLASLPIVGKIVKPLKTVKGVKNVPIIKTGDVPGKPEWFDQLVNKVIIEGDDVTKRFATQDRQVVHMKKIDDETSVTVTQDLNDGSIMVDIDDPIRNVMGEGGDDTSVMMMLKKGQADETTKVKPADEFSFTENDMRNYMDGPDDYTTEFTENTVNRMKDLTSDLGKIKSYATGKGPTMKQIVESKKRQDKVRFAEDKPAEYAAERAPDIDYSDYDDGMASGGIAGMLGE